MDAIFAFHSLDDRGSVLSFPPQHFGPFVDALLRAGTQIVSLDELRRPGGTGHRAVLTFDDGMQSVHEHALPAVRERGVPATVYVVSDWVGKDNRWPGQPPGIAPIPLMTWEQLRACQEGGMTIGAHTCNHPHLDRLGEAEASLELSRCQATLEERLGGPVRHLAYPYGSHAAATARLAAAWFDTAVTTEMSFVRPGHGVYEWPRIDTYYLRDPRVYSAVFSARGRAYLRLRALARRVRRIARRG